MMKGGWEVGMSVSLGNGGMTVWPERAGRRSSSVVIKVKNQVRIQKSSEGEVSR